MLTARRKAADEAEAEEELGMWGVVRGALGAVWPRNWWRIASGSANVRSEVHMVFHL